VVVPAEASDHEAENRQPWIYRTEETPLVSNHLGVGTLPVCVVIKEKRLPGLYITTPAGGLGYKMGLSRGCVLLSIDGYSMANARELDQWLERRPPAPLKYTFVRKQGGVPKLYSGQIPYPQTTAKTVNLSSSTPARLSSLSGKAASVDELENYGVSLINDSRQVKNKSRLQSDAALSRMAREYAEYMLRHKDQYGFPLRRNPHIDLEGRIPMLRAFAAGIMNEVHENLGMESRDKLSDADLLLKQHRIMMSEPPGQHNHRSIILDDAARLVGVGIARDQDSLYLVEEFGH
jgi:uncharacterized protein YkwD